MNVVVLSCRCYLEKHIADFEHLLYNTFNNKYLRSECTKTKAYWVCRFYVEGISIQDMIDCSVSIKATHIEIEMENYYA